MRTILKPRDIIDRRALSASLDAIALHDGADSERRARFMEALKGALKSGDDEIRTRLENGSYQGDDCVAARSYMMDQLIRVLFDHAINHLIRRGVPTTGERIAVLAIGGYGRGELAPLSDIDLLFLLPYKETPFTEQLVEFILYSLWDLGLKVGQSVRSIDENIVHAKADITVRTSLLDARWIWGDQDLAAEFKKRFQKDIVDGSGAQFVQAKLAERDARHEKTGDSRYRLEPNVKDDKGGLRDLHTLYWIAKYLYGVSDVRRLADLGLIDDDAAMRFAKAHDFLNTVRCHLHYISGRADNRLTFDLQRDIAKRMNYSDRAGSTATERFMRHYFLIVRDVGDLTRVFITMLEEKGRRKPLIRLPAALRRRKVDDFLVDGGRIALTDAEAARTPLKLLQIFRTAQAHALDFQPDALRVIARNAKRITALRDNPAANAVFMDILTEPKGSEAILRLMSEAGVFGRFIPDFARVVAQMQYDMYHVYTTDEHTIRAIGILNRIEQGKLKTDLPVASEVIHKVQSRRALYVAVMLHDIAKGRGGDHSDLGADIALELCPRLGLTPEETESVSWLVRYHLLMSNTAFKRDLDDPQTIAAFTEAVQSPERLRLLLVLTCADIRAVGPNVWNNWKATLLRELYHRAEEYMSGGQNTATRDARIAAKREALAARLKDWPEDVREAAVSSPSPAYWLAYDTDIQERHMRFIRAAETKNETAAIDFEVVPKRAATSMLVYTPDHPGLFAKIAGALSLSGVSIVDAKILTLANGMALDTFYFQDYDGEPITQESRLARIKARIKTALEGRVRFNQELSKTSILRVPTRAKAMEVPPRVFIDNTASKVCSVIEINGHDRAGFLFDVTKTLTDLGLQIASAHISTYGERVVDVFYVKDVFGMKVENETKLRQIRDALGKTIGVAAGDVSIQARKPAALSSSPPRAAE
ncbi:MAG: [protein-PII] uridylyltransferase [Rhodospirillaceae bacterium]|nr:[protein-PII] uridylyltransferase [Rhodospirillaceae bacterium]